MTFYLKAKNDEKTYCVVKLLYKALLLNLYCKKKSYETNSGFLNLIF